MAVAPGWYTDPEYAGQLRWWSGEAWTEHRAPVPVAAPVAVAPSVIALRVVAPQQFPQQTLLSFAPPQQPPQQQPQQSPVPAQQTTPTSTRDRARGWVVLAVGVVVMALFLGSVFEFGGFTKAVTSDAPLGTSSSGTGQSASDALDNFGTPTAPDGMVPSSTSTVSTRTTAGSQFAGGIVLFPLKFVSLPECTDLDYVQPVLARDAGSSDAVLVLPSFRSPETPSALIVSASVRSYSSAAAAKTELSQMTSTFNDCQQGYLNDGVPVQVTGMSASFNDQPSSSWVQSTTYSSLGVDEFETVNFLQNKTIVRAQCDFVTPKSNTTSTQCLSWLAQLQTTLAKVG